MSVPLVTYNAPIHQPTPPEISILPHPKKHGRQATLIVKVFNQLHFATQAMIRGISHTRKVVVYHCSLFFNVAMNTILPRFWKWWSVIDDQILLGAIPLRNKGDLASLKKIGVTHVLSKVEDFEYQNGIFTRPLQKKDWTESNVYLRRSPTVDGCHINVDQLYLDIAWMKCRIDEGKKVYVHCKAGRGRSAATVIMYYMVYHKMTFQQAFNFVKSKRCQVYLSPYQKSELQKLEKSAYKTHVLN